MRPTELQCNLRILLQSLLQNLQMHELTLKKTFLILIFVTPFTLLRSYETVRVEASFSSFSSVLHISFRVELLSGPLPSVGQRLQLQAVTCVFMCCFVGLGSKLSYHFLCYPTLATQGNELGWVFYRNEFRSTQHYKYKF